MHQVTKAWASAHMLGFSSNTGRDRGLIFFTERIGSLPLLNGQTKSQGKSSLFCPLRPTKVMSLHEEIEIPADIKVELPSDYLMQRLKKLKDCI